MLLESDFNAKWKVLMNEIANSSSIYNNEHFVKIGMYNIFRFMSKFSKVGYDCLICSPS